jgi:hypothetical protein
MQCRPKTEKFTLDAPKLRRGAISDSQHDLSNFAQERTNAVALPLGYTKDTSLL